LKRFLPRFIFRTAKIDKLFFLPKAFSEKNSQQKKLSREVGYHVLFRPKLRKIQMLKHKALTVFFPERGKLLHAHPISRRLFIFSLKIQTVLTNL
jgi:hypothetical protein